MTHKNFSNMNLYPSSVLDNLSVSEKNIFYKKSIKSKKDDLSLWSRRKRNNGNLGNLGDKNGSMKFQIDANEKLKCGISLISPPFSYQLATWFRRRIIFQMLDTCLRGHEIGIFYSKTFISEKQSIFSKVGELPWGVFRRFLLDVPQNRSFYYFWIE